MFDPVESRLPPRRAGSVLSTRQSHLWLGEWGLLPRPVSRVPPTTPASGVCLTCQNLVPTCCLAYPGERGLRSAGPAASRLSRRAGSAPATRQASRSTRPLLRLTSRLRTRRTGSAAVSSLKCLAYVLGERSLPLVYPEAVSHLAR